MGTDLQIHPFLVHFPIALVLIGTFFDTISFIKTKNLIKSINGYNLLLIGTASSVLAQLSGFFFTEHPNFGDIKQVFEQHELYALISVIVLFVATISRTIIILKKNETVSFSLLQIFLQYIACLLIIYTGYLGGVLVHDF